MPSQFKKDKLTVMVFDDRQLLGAAAATMVSDKIKDLLRQKKYITIVFAAAPSQNEFLQALLADTTINWESINAFHMDEYLGLPEGSPHLFSSFLKSNLFAHVPFRSVNYINGNAPDIQKECDRYTMLLNDNPPDMVCMGIGENTHIAFNDPHKADFNDPKSIKMVSLDLVCRQQQVNDGCFDTVNDCARLCINLNHPGLNEGTVYLLHGTGKNKSTRHLAYPYRTRNRRLPFNHIKKS